MKLVFEDDQVPYREFEVSARLKGSRSRRGEVYIRDMLSVELKKEVLWEDILATLPDVHSLLLRGKLRYTMEDFFTGSCLDRLHTRWIWFELGSTLLQIRVLLAEARSYKTLEPRELSDPLDRPLLDIHFRKMEKLNLAVFYLAKIEDLVLRLLFENIEASLVEVDMSKQDWERQLRWENIREGLKRRTDNPALARLSDDEYTRIKEILDAFRQPAFVQALVEYRDQVTHRITPSVDYPHFYVHLDSRIPKTLYDSRGQKKGESWKIAGMSNKPRYTFDKLWGVALETFGHYVSLLGKLKEMPWFGPEAILGYPAVEKE